MDEPDAPLSFTAFLGLACLLHGLAGDRPQAVVATRSPIVAAVPGAVIWERGPSCAAEPGAAWDMAAGPGLV
jgi:predicted ATPase